MCVSFRCRYIRLEKLDKSSQDTLSLLVARSGTKRNRPPPSEKLAFQTPPADFAKCRRLQSVLFTLYPISPGSHIYPGTRRDIALLVAVGEVWWKSLPLCIRGGHVKLAVVGNEQAARFYKFASKVLWSRRHLVSWESCHKVVANPSEPSTAASESERKRVLILLIYTAGRALGEQLPTTLPPTSPYFSQSYDSASQMVSVRTIR